MPQFLGLQGRETQREETDAKRSRSSQNTRRGKSSSAMRGYPQQAGRAVLLGPGSLSQLLRTLLSLSLQPAPSGHSQLVIYRVPSLCKLIKLSPLQIQLLPHLSLGRKQTGLAVLWNHTTLIIQWAAFVSNAHPGSLC